MTKFEEKKTCILKTWLRTISNQITFKCTAKSTNPTRVIDLKSFEIVDMINAWYHKPYLWNVLLYQQTLLVIDPTSFQIVDMITIEFIKQNILKCNAISNLILYKPKGFRNSRHDNTRYHNIHILTGNGVNTISIPSRDFEWPEEGPISRGRISWNNIFWNVILYQILFFIDRKIFEIVEI